MKCRSVLSGRTVFSRIEKLFPCRTVHRLGQSGNLLIVIIVLFTVVAVLGAALVALYSRSVTSQVTAGQTIRTQYLAEAGGRYGLSRIRTLPTGPSVFKFGNGNTFFTVDKTSNTDFTVTGVIGEGNWAETKVRIQYILASPFDFGLFGGDSLAIDNNAHLDSYKSSGGVYDPDAHNANGHIGTNNTADAGLQIDAGAVIEGNVMSEVGKDMIPPLLPSGAATWEDKTALLHFSSNNDTRTLDTGRYRTSDITITNNSTLTITGDVTIYVEGDINAFNESILNITSGASLTIYAGGNVDLANNSVVNGASPSIPADFLLCGLEDCHSVQLSNDSDTHCAVFAPRASIYTGNNADVYGSLVGRQITVRQDAAVHYDEDLAGLNAGSICTVRQVFLDSDGA